MCSMQWRAEVSWAIAHHKLQYYATPALDVTTSKLFLMVFLSCWTRSQRNQLVRAVERKKVIGDFDAKVGSQRRHDVIGYYGL